MRLKNDAIETKLNVKGAKLLKLPEKVDGRGSLCFCEAGVEKLIPFEIKRSFWIYNTPRGALRGYHAHRESRQAHVCLQGSAKIWLDDGKNHEDVVLNRPNQVLVLEPMIWHHFQLKKGSLLFVFTSNWYDGETDYIRNFQEFCRLTS